MTYAERRAARHARIAQEIAAKQAAGKAQPIGSISMTKAEALRIQAEQVAHYSPRCPGLAEHVAALTTADQLDDGLHPVWLINRHIPRGGAIENIVAKLEREL